MKYIKGNGKSDVVITPAALILSGLEEAQKLEMHTLDGAIVLLNGRMTVMELISAAESLTSMASELTTKLIMSCGRCDGCGGDCPFEEDETIHMPAYLLDEAKIPENAKLCAVPNPDDGTITVSETSTQHDLSDVPPDLMDVLKKCGICMGSLEELLAEDSVIYGE